MAPSLSWGIIGTGNIARTFAKELPHSQTGKLYAVASRTQESADRFSADFPNVKIHIGYESLLADPKVEAVYISTPHPQHAEWAIAAAEAGKHILCEKPLGLNAAEAMAIIEAARRNGVFLMEAFMYRCHPRTAQIAELIQAGVIGRVKLIRAAFSCGGQFNPNHRLFSNALGGGGILDIGCYATSIAQFVAGAAIGRPFADPMEVTGTGILCETGVDVVAAATLKFPSDILAQLSCAATLRQESDLMVYGENGTLRVPTFWNPPGPILLHHYEDNREEAIESSPSLYKYALEADAVAQALPAQESPFVSWDDTLSNMRVLDRWREVVGVRYDAEEASAPEQKLPISRRPLRLNHYAEIPQSSLGGLGKPIARLILGVDNQLTMPHLAVMADDYMERGGNAFDTAFIYGGGIQERLLGTWIRNRGIREKVVVTVKGAHTPFCTPEHLREQFEQSLERLDTDYADIYMIHRDNPDVPAGEFVDVLDELRSEGKMRLYGGSNWTMERLNEANAYAIKHGREPFRVVSNNFSLARMINPIWDGGISSKGAAWREWFLQNQAALLAWSSQARGYFAPDRLSGTVSDAELLRCWDSKDNRERRERAQTLAKKKGISPLNIALAFVLNQPFPTFALIGPRTINETRTALAGGNLHLSPEELAWLDLEKGT